MLMGLALAIAALGACSNSPNASHPSLPGGSYINVRFHFRIAYPAGWQVSTGPSPTTSNPLTVEITRSGSQEEAGSLVSMLEISVLSLSNAGVVATATALPSRTGMSATTLSGVPAYADGPTQQPVPGTSAIDTHADYYLAFGAYEYHLSTDSLSTDDSAGALANMLSSFLICCGA
jgi:hypothetical protein